MLLLSVQLVTEFQAVVTRDFVGWALPTLDDDWEELAANQKYEKEMSNEFERLEREDVALFTTYNWLL